LDALIEKHIKETEAVVPIPNPNFDSTKYRPELMGTEKKGFNRGECWEIIGLDIY